MKSLNIKLTNKKKKKKKLLILILCIEFNEVKFMFLMFKERKFKDVK